MTKKGFEVGALITLVVGALASFFIWNMKVRIEAAAALEPRMTVIETKVEGMGQRFDRLDTALQRIWDAVQRK